MTVSELQWLIGTAITTVLAIAGIAIAAFRATASRIDAVAVRVKEGDDQLHDRINRVRDEYVRRVDLDSHLARIETNVRDMREEYREGTREINQRLDAVLISLQPADGRKPPRR